MAVVKRTVPSSTPVKKLSPTPSSSPPVTLPTTVSIPSQKLGDYSILFFGDKKIGKTSLAAMFPDALFLMTEPGARALPVYQTPILEWKTFRESLRLLRSPQGNRFKTVVVDTVDLAFKMAETYACQKMGITHPSEEDWGRGWGAVRDEFTTQMQILLNMGKGVILISHATEREIKTRSGVKYDRIQPTMSNQARDVVEGMVDIWAYYTYDGQQRVLRIRGDEHITAGHRLQNNFRYGGNEVRDIDMGTSAEESYRNLIACFNNKYKPVIVHEESDTARPITIKKILKKV
jgi:hypothetical protein